MEKAYDVYSYDTDVGRVDEYALFSQPCICGAKMHPVIRVIQPRHKEYISYLVAQCPWCNRRVISADLPGLVEDWNNHEYEEEESE